MGVRSTSSHPTTTKADGHLLEYSRNTFVEGGGGTNVFVREGISASGGITTSFAGSDGKAYKIHKFTSSPQTFSVSAIGNVGSDCDVIIVGGGGGGGEMYGGGGGAGGLVAGTVTVSTSPGSYTISVGGGGAKSSGSGNPGSNGTNTTAFGVTALGGGGAGSGPGPATPGEAGGSGGGADGVSPNTGGAGNQPGQSIPGTMTNYGNAGGGPGTGNPSYYCGGGGGAGGAGGSPAIRYGGPGILIPTLFPGTPTPEAQKFSPTGALASGGAGGAYADAAPQISSNTNPSGGGFAGRTYSPPFTYEANGQENTGGGGGGDSPGGYNGGNGGSGVVLVRYEIGIAEIGT